MIVHLFVYGTLRPGQQRWPFLEPFVVDEGADAVVEGTLFDTGNGYPAARFDRNGDIHGRLYELRAGRIDEALQRLDEVEGAVTDLFHRVEVTTRSGRTAWAYEYGGSDAFAEIRSGNWLEPR
ncbi:MAG TPA: gamma-glutamylcyclotransferase family protein [Ilumatobacteraceae bacterium]